MRVCVRARVCKCVLLVFDSGTPPSSFAVHSLTSYFASPQRSHKRLLGLSVGMCLKIEAEPLLRRFPCFQKLVLRFYCEHVATDLKNCEFLECRKRVGYAR
mmetsp:Transcript_20985/g.33601  ORF Transcript_20985/g.33601 Transcript_20985/m.33601 type:complete len:101 (+) Transcript_20985:14-316(+)